MLSTLPYHSNYTILRSPNATIPTTIFGFLQKYQFQYWGLRQKIHPVSTPTNAAKQMAGKKLFRRSASLHTYHCLQKTDCQSKNDIK